MLQWLVICIMKVFKVADTGIEKKMDRKGNQKTCFRKHSK